MKESINAKVEKFIRAFVGGKMEKKEATIHEIKRQLREDSTAWSRMVGLSFEEENYLLFSSLDFDYSSQSQVKRLIIDTWQDLQDGGVNPKYKVRCCYYLFNQIDLNSKEWHMAYKDEISAMISRFKESVLDAFEFANKNPKLAKAAFEDALSCLNKIKEMVCFDKEESKMKKSINAKVEWLIYAYFNGDMGMKGFIMETIEEELRNGWNQTSEAIRLTYEEENYIMFSPLALPVSPKNSLFYLMGEMRACLDKCELTKNDIRKFHYIFSQIDFDKVRKPSLSEDTLWGAVDRCELAICDALTLAKSNYYDDAMDFINFALLCIDDLGSLVWGNYIWWETEA